MGTGRDEDEAIEAATAEAVAEAFAEYEARERAARGPPAPRATTVRTEAQDPGAFDALRGGAGIDHDATTTRPHDVTARFEAERPEARGTTLRLEARSPEARATTLAFEAPPPRGATLHLEAPAPAAERATAEPKPRGATLRADGALGRGVTVRIELPTPEGPTTSRIDARAVRDEADARPTLRPGEARPALRADTVGPARDRAETVAPSRGAGRERGDAGRERGGAGRDRVDAHRDHADAHRGRGDAPRDPTLRAETLRPRAPDPAHAASLADTLTPEPAGRAAPARAAPVRAELIAPSRASAEARALTGQAALPRRTRQESFDEATVRTALPAPLDPFAEATPAFSTARTTRSVTALDPTHRASEAQVADWLEGARRSDYFATLGLPPRASTRDVERAHARALDALEQLDPSPLIREARATLDAARDVLADPATRSTYARHVQHGRALPIFWLPEDDRAP